MEHADSPAADIFSRSSPLALQSVEATHTSGVGAGYELARSRANWAAGLLGVTVAVHLLSLLALASQRSLLDRGAGNVTFAEWHSATSHVATLATVGLALYVLTAVVFLRWLHRCYVNLPALGVRAPRFTPGWAVGYWFIPFLNLVRPRQILDELWRATDDDRAAAEPATRASLPSSSLTSFWLAAMIGAALTSRVAATGSGTTIDGLKFTNEWLLVSELAQIAAAGLMLRLVLLLTARQEARADGDF